MDAGRPVRQLDSLWRQTEPWVVSCVPLIFTQENGEAQKKAQLLVTEPEPPGPLALDCTLWSTVGLARGELPDDPDGDSIKQ